MLMKWIVIGDDHLKQGKSQLISLLKQQLMKNGLHDKHYTSRRSLWIQQRKKE